MLEKQPQPRDPQGQPEDDTPAPLARPATLFSPKIRAIFILVVITGALSYFGYVAFTSATVSYHSVSSALSLGQTAEGRHVGVKGKLVNGSYARTPDGLVANFRVRDEDGPAQLPVRYAGDVGQVFFNEHSELILQGSIGIDGVMAVENLTVRCPSKYLTETERAELEAEKKAESRPAYQQG